MLWLDRERTEAKTRLINMQKVEEHNTKVSMRLKSSVMGKENERAEG